MQPKLEILEDRCTPSSVVGIYDPKINISEDGIIRFAVVPALSENTPERVEAVALFAKYADKIYPGIKVQAVGLTQEEILVAAIDAPTTEILGMEYPLNGGLDRFGNKAYINAFLYFGQTESVTNDDLFLTEGFARSIIETNNILPYTNYKAWVEYGFTPVFPPGSVVTFKIAHPLQDLNLHDMQVALDKVLANWQKLLPSITLKQVYGNEFATVLLNATLDEFKIDEAYSELKQQYIDEVNLWSVVDRWGSHSAVSMFPDPLTNTQQINMYPYQIYVFFNGTSSRDWVLDLPLGDNGDRGSNMPIICSWENILEHEIGHNFGLYDLYFSGLEFAEMGFWAGTLTWFEKIGLDIIYEQNP